MNKQLEVRLSHASNPDIDGGYWQEGNSSARKHFVSVATLRDASNACRAYIEKNGLGGGNWTGGQVIQGNKDIARISYNGRIWDMNDNEIAA